MASRQASPNPFPIFDQADLVVVFDDNQAPAANSVTGVGLGSGGDVVFDAPPPLATRITIYRDMAFARETDFQEAGDFRAAVINEELDRMAMLLQQAEMLVADSVHKPLYEADSDLVLPSVATRAGKVLTFDENGLPAVGSPSEEAATLAATSASAAAVSATTAATAAAYVINTAVPVQQLSGDGATLAFVLSRTVVDSTSIGITIDGVKQHTATYTASGTSLAFTQAPPAGTDNIEVTFIGFSGILAELPSIPDAFRNNIINGNFEIWQRGVTGFGHNEYSSDRWTEATNTDDTLAISRQAFTPGQTDVPGEPAYFLRAALTAGVSGSVNDFRQKVEDVRTLAGQTATLSFWIKGSVAATINTIRIAQNFGGGGSAAVTTNLTDVNVTTAWQKVVKTVSIPSITGKTIGTSSNLDVTLGLPVNATVDIDIARVQLEAGAVATPFEHRPIGDTLALCQRYFYTTGLANQGTFAVGQCITATTALFYIQFPVAMRAAPSFSVSAVSDFMIFDANSNASVATALTQAVPSPTGSRLSGTRITGLVAGNASMLLDNNVGTAKLNFSAEL